MVEVSATGFPQREAEVRADSLTAIAFRRFLRNRGAMIGLVCIAAVIACAILAPALTPYDPIKMSATDRLSSPSGAHLLGTDLYGRDILSRLLFGARLSLQTGLISVSIAAVILGSSLTNAMIAVGISSVPSFARLVRGCVLSAKENVYVEAAKAIGCGDLRIVFRHILPNVAAPLIVVSTLGVAWAILNVAALSFLGLGAQPPTPEWGTMLSEGRDYLRVAPWIATFPGVAIMILVIAVNVMGDGLRVALDPRMKL
jgi:peptide/nickel transport system permease protein